VTGAARRRPIRCGALRAALPALLLLLAACEQGGRAVEVPGAAPTAAGQPALPTARARVGDAELQVELATTPEQRAAGLRGRDVPVGTGMAFRYPGGEQVRFTMSGVDRPLVAVFAWQGRARSVEQLAPCAGTVAQCPTYGPAGPVDVVVEAAPGSLPSARPGDPVTVG